MEETKDVTTVVPTIARRTRKKTEIVPEAEQNEAAPVVPEVPVTEEMDAEPAESPEIEEQQAEIAAMDAAAKEEALKDSDPEAEQKADEKDERSAEAALENATEAKDVVDTEDSTSSSEIEAEMYANKDTSILSEAATDVKTAKEQERGAVREEKEKVLTQLSLAGAKKNEGSQQQIKGITQASRQKKREIYSDNNIIPLHDSLQFESEGQKRRKDYMELVSSKRSLSPLTGSIFSITTTDGRICAVVNYGCFTVLIPSEKLLSAREEAAIDKEEDEGEKTRMCRRYATQRIGSEIDFVVAAVDEESMVAVGDRRRAMEIKKQAWYLAHEQNGEPALKKGTLVEARVVEASRNMLCVEVFGIEYILREHDIAYVQIPDVSAEYPVGTTVPVVFTELERTRKDEGIVIHGHVSIKEAVTDPRKKEFDRIQLKDLLSATVTGTNENGIIVRLGGMNGKQDAMCQFQKKTKSRGFSANADIPEIGRNVIVKIRKKEEFDSKKQPIYRVYGDIIRVL